MPRGPLPPDLVEFVDAPRPSVVAVMRADGYPVTAATWYEWDDGRVLLPMLRSSWRLKHVRADPRIRHAGARPSDVEPRAVSALAQSASTLAAPTAISAGASMSVGEAGKQPASRLLGSLNRRVFVANEHWKRRGS